MANNVVRHRNRLAARVRRRCLSGGEKRRAGTRLRSHCTVSFTVRDIHISESNPFPVFSPRTLPLEREEKTGYKVDLRR